MLVHKICGFILWIYMCYLFFDFFFFLIFFFCDFLISLDFVFFSFNFLIPFPSNLWTLSWACLQQFPFVFPLLFVFLFSLLFLTLLSHFFLNGTTKYKNKSEKMPTIFNVKFPSFRGHDKSASYSLARHNCISIKVSVLE